MCHIGTVLKGIPRKNYVAELSLFA